MTFPHFALPQPSSPEDASSLQEPETARPSSCLPARLLPRARAPLSRLARRAFLLPSPPVIHAASSPPASFPPLAALACRRQRGRRAPPRLDLSPGSERRLLRRALHALRRRDDGPLAARVGRDIRVAPAQRAGCRRGRGRVGVGRHVRAGRRRQLRGRRRAHGGQPEYGVGRLHAEDCEREREGDGWGRESRD